MLLGVPGCGKSLTAKAVAKAFEEGKLGIMDYYKMQNVVAVNEGYYDYPTATTYMDTIVECEKMGDYIVNVVEAIADSKLHPVND